MGLLSALAIGPVTSTPLFLATVFGTFFAAAIVLNVAKQLLWRQLGIGRDKPPVVFHWVPVLGNTIEYGMEPFKFFEKCRNKVIQDSSVMGLLYSIELICTSF